MNALDTIDVIQPALKHHKSLEEQKSDFTSEGAPPAVVPAVVPAGSPALGESTDGSLTKEDPAQSRDLERELDA